MLHGEFVLHLYNVGSGMHALTLKTTKTSPGTPHTRRTRVPTVGSIDTINGEETDGVDSAFNGGFIDCRLGHLHGGSSADSHDLPAAHDACTAFALECGLAGGHQTRLAQQSRLHFVVNRDRRCFSALNCLAADLRTTAIGVQSERCDEKGINVQDASGFSMLCSSWHTPLRVGGGGSNVVYNTSSNVTRLLVLQNCAQQLLDNTIIRPTR